MQFAQVVIDLPQRWADRLYTYAIPPQLEGQVLPGWAVTVPFGEDPHTAYVVEVLNQRPAGDYEIKTIQAVLGTESVWPQELMELAAWMSDLYVCTLSEAFQAVVPPSVLRHQIRPPKSRRKSQAVQGLGEDYRSHQLNPAQIRVLEQIVEGTHSTLLLEGITGSGKTEVYLAALESVLAKGKAAIALVPEVSLTPQAIDRYRARLGDQVALLHSRLSDGERWRQWSSLRQGRCKVALGTRSAIFAPLENLGLILLDEEHDHSYKQDSSPRYHARQVASWRARRHGAQVLLGSATPCLESFAAASNGQYLHLHLPHRANQQELPKVEVIDLRRHRLRGREDLSTPLVVALRQTLDRGEQAVLLYNRRGYSRYLQCLDCGHVLHCPHCSIAQTLHRHSDGPPSLLCHYCGHQNAVPEHCPKCGGLSLRDCGSGTERLAEEVGQRFPRARLLRMDRDTTQRQGSHQQLLRAFAQGEADILLGTQMVSKGLDFPNVTLVGVVGADQGLHIPDFRASERVLQLLTQVSGRSGRGHHPGRVLLQAMDADHPIFAFAHRHDYIGFLMQEKDNRRALVYPPFCRLGRVLITGKNPEKVEKSARRLGDWILSNYPQQDLLGPSPCPLEKIQGQYRWHFLLKGKKVKELSEILRNALQQCKGSSGVRWTADIDPQSLL